jgi:hypothetical protein
LSCSFRIRVHNLTPLRSLSTSRKYVVLLLLHPRLQSHAITFLLLQEVRCPGLFASASTISCRHVPFPPPVCTLSCFLCILVYNLIPLHFLFTSRKYVVLLPLCLRSQSHFMMLPLHIQRVCCPTPQFDTVTLPLYFQEVRCIPPLIFASSILHHRASSLSPGSTLFYLLYNHIRDLTSLRFFSAPRK